MKKMFIVLLSLVMVLAFASVAVAATTGNNERAGGWNPPGPTYSGPNILTGNAQLRGGTAYVAGTNVHQSYTTTSNKCEACHSPHKAGSSPVNHGNSYKLLYGTTAAGGANGLCEICHVGQSYAVADVYTNSYLGSPLTIRSGHNLQAMTNGMPDSSWATPRSAARTATRFTVRT
jgi:hypothetical protein